MSTNDLCLSLVRIISASLSIIGSLFNVIMYFIFNDLRNEATELIVYLSISCIFTNISFYLKFNNKEDLMCQIQGFGLFSSQISSQIWVTLISYTAYIKTVSNNSDFNFKERIIYFILGYIIPLGIAFTILFLGQIGVSDLNHWCWSNNDLIVWLYYLLLWILMILSFYFMRKLTNFLRNILNQNIEDNNLIEKFTSKLKYITFIQFFYVSIFTIVRLQKLIIKAPPIIDDLILYIILLILNVQGLFFAIVFGLIPMVRDKLKTLCEKYCCLKINKNEVSVTKLMERDSKFSNTKLMERDSKFSNTKLMERDSNMFT